jgi:hypothetical protein
MKNTFQVLSATAVALSAILLLAGVMVNHRSAVQVERTNVMVADGIPMPPPPPPPQKPPNNLA